MSKKTSLIQKFWQWCHESEVGFCSLLHLEHEECLQWLDEDKELDPKRERLIRYLMAHEDAPEDVQDVLSLCVWRLEKRLENIYKMTITVDPLSQTF
ncbi:MAG: hypothetical protein WC253_06165 [Sulfurovaceae bacterium]|nr:hypothetical protein [Sulfurovaceae bacterium]